MTKWWRRRPTNRDVDDEIAFHLSEETRLRVAEGERADEARYGANRVFGNVVLHTENTREAWGRRAWDTLRQDMRHGLRLLGRNKLFSAFCIVSLALGIGGTSAIFSLYEAIVVRELPVREPERLITLSIQSATARPNSFMPYPQFESMQRRAQTIEGLFARTTFPTISVGAGGAAAIASGLAVTGGYHATLGLVPRAGRLLTSDDDRPGHGAVVVLSHAYWMRRFGGSPSIVGQTIALNRAPFTVIGVEPEGFFGVTVGSTADVTIPMRGASLLTGNEPPWNAPFGTWLEVMGRLRPDVSIVQATSELDGIFRQVTAEAASTLAPDSGDARFARDTHLLAAPGGTGGVSGLRNQYRPGLRLLLLLLGGVLALASLNVAALLLSRAEARRGEIITRMALGAGRRRIVRQLVTESTIIAACGGALGMLLAWRGSEMLMRLATSTTDTLPLDLSPNRTVIAFTTAVSMASCVVFGVLPATRATAAANTASRGEAGARRRRVLDRSLVVTQTAVALVLIVTAGLFLQSLRNLWGQDTGYDRSNIVTFSIDTRLIGKRGPEALRVYQTVLEELRAIPSAQSVAVTTVRPVSDSYYLIDRVTQIGERTLADADSIRIAFNTLGDGYFRTMGIQLLNGRDFDARDVESAPKVAIISQLLARQFEGNPIGQRLAIGPKDVREVIGVVADSRYARVTDAPRAVVYMPFFQGAPRFPPTFVIKHAGSAADALRAATDAVARVDPALAVYRAKTLDVETQESFAKQRLLALLTTYFAIFAWLLAGIGLYGLLAYSVAQRRREFGVRMALGAQPSAIGRAVLREGTSTVLAGLAMGLLGALAISRVVRSELYGEAPADTTAIAVAAVTLLLIAAAASFFPARRASRIDPMTALRQE